MDVENWIAQVTGWLRQGKRIQRKVARFSKAHPFAVAASVVSLAGGTSIVFATNHWLRPPRAFPNEPSSQQWIRQAAYMAYKAERLALWTLTFPGLRRAVGGSSSDAEHGSTTMKDLLEAATTPHGTEPCVLLDASVYKRDVPKFAEEDTATPILRLRKFAANAKKLWIVAEAIVLSGTDRVGRSEGQEIPPRLWTAVRNPDGVHATWHHAFKGLPSLKIDRPEYVVTGYLTNIIAFQLGRLDLPINAFTVLPRNVDPPAARTDGASTNASAPQSADTASLRNSAPSFFWHPVPAPPDPVGPVVSWRVDRLDNATATCGDSKSASVTKRAVVLLLAVSERATLSNRQLDEIAARTGIPIQSYVRAVCEISVLNDGDFVAALRGLDSVLKQTDVKQDDTLIIVQTGPVALSLWLGKMSKQHTHPLGRTEVLIVEPRPLRTGSGAAVSYVDAAVANADGSLRPL